MPTQHGACCTSRDDAGLVVDPRRCSNQAQHALRVVELQLVQADPVREHVGDGRADLKGHICNLIVLDRRQELQGSQTLSNTGGAQVILSLGVSGRQHLQASAAGLQVGCSNDLCMVTSVQASWSLLQTAAGS